MECGGSAAAFEDRGKSGHVRSLIAFESGGVADRLKTSDRRRHGG